MVRAVVIRAAGINCEAEMARGFELAGAAVDLVHVRALAADPDRLDDYALIGFPGGFSYGDDAGSGRVLSLTVRERLYPALRRAAGRGAAMLGICNGFQVLTQAGLLPGPPETSWPAEPTPATLALAENARGRYADRWVRIEVDAASPCIWTRDLADDPSGEPMLPVGHGEGRFVAEQALVDDLLRTGRAPLRYADNFNGSAGGIAGVCDASGRIFGLMPHPDRYLDWSRHPHWTRLDPGALADHSTPGLKLFRNAVEAARGAALVG
ncbi:MAG: phosphoribosylformylglycinamidine synthase subunit PurQ [Planctomycetota bacterium]